MILCDIEIKDLAEAGMIEPFVPVLTRESNGKKVISYGLSSYGYDIRLSPTDFRVFRHIPGTVVDPKNFNPDNLEPVQMRSDDYGDYFVIPAHTYGLGVSLERISMPPDVTAIALGKSTYARTSIIANITPIEAGWRGYITLEFSNSSSADTRIYANEGVIQLLFFRGKPCFTTYADRSGKYQDQGNKVTLAKV